MTAFDRDARRRERLRRAEARATWLDDYRCQLERILALALRVAVGGTDVSPEALLAVLEEMDAHTQCGLDERQAFALMCQPPELPLPKLLDLLGGPA